MELRPAFLLQTIVKAMSDVILPAVDPNNKLAQEQARLVIGMLNLVSSRLPLMYRYDRDELSRFLALASTLQSLAKDLPGADGALHALDNTFESGADVLSRLGQSLMSWKPPISIYERRSVLLSRRLIQPPTPQNSSKSAPL
jgi:hypothetical protein